MAVYRFIPAGAGNTAPAPTTDPAPYGSSPRVRGTQPPGALHQRRGRFIPAGAGNTLLGVHCQDVSTVHPRGCGEHSLGSDRLLTSAGSSPRVRGTQASHWHGLSTGRFIPAGAGNTWYRGYPRPKPAVHPRGCGEHFALLVTAVTDCGSSPRVRGTLDAFRDEAYSKRFIPAGAGNTHSLNGLAKPSSVHPRGCGEHISNVASNVR